ncbi:adhesion G-protein coupled receptor F3-like isoform X2 [Polypterus senegalus]|nr:adhesion G-protein coupled receptor F3-like isoform X2 [Polypterus senegalus]XP_039604925.1 adhesion G-protein coupled receptor F3-like isoform X2 [Polypterus senegalus]XP_039604926.1 adhesion G-protein coupled receptor F3-like isoform X2 [Polypterus senegalus]
MQVCNVSSIDSPPRCQSIHRVHISGELTLNESPEYLQIPAKVNEFQQQANAILKPVFSVLLGYDGLSLGAPRSGSIIIPFDIFVNDVSGQINSSWLNLAVSNFKGTVSLKVTGLAKLSTTSDKVKYNEKVNFTCLFESSHQVEWSISANNNTTPIVNGSNAVLSNGPSGTYNLIVLSAIQNWQGNYTCKFQDKNITYLASTFLQIAFLPETIIGYMEPQFPDCRTPRTEQVVTVICNITNDFEQYNITWNTDRNISNILPTNPSGSVISSKNVVLLSCNKPSNLNCTFTNTMSQSKSMVIPVFVINDSSDYCNVDQNWPLALANHAAVLYNCDPGKTGNKTRRCVSKNTWGNEIDLCTTVTLNDIYKQVQVLISGQGVFKDNIASLVKNLSDTSSATNTIETVTDIGTSVLIMHSVTNAGNASDYRFKVGEMKDMATTANNLLYQNLSASWNLTTLVYNQSTASRLLASLETMSGMGDAGNHSKTNFTNVYLDMNQVNGTTSFISSFDCNVTLNSLVMNGSNITSLLFRTLSQFLPQNNDSLSQSNTVNSFIQTVTSTKDSTAEISFRLLKRRNSSYQIYCAYWDFTKNNGNGAWSTDGCEWKKSTVSTEVINCSCTHTSSFTVLMSIDPITLPYLDMITYCGLGISIFFLTACLFIEYIIWSAVVKSSISLFRHVALVNICLCLLVGNCCFLAASFINKSIKTNLCFGLAIAMHFCFVAMFFWMLCQSLMLLHQLLFVFHQLRKATYIQISFLFGYIIPAGVVLAAYFYFQDDYVNYDLCWLKYSGDLSGSIYFFVVPTLSIVAANYMTMIIVILKIMRPKVSDSSNKESKEVVKSILKAVIILTPLFGLTWALGFLTMTIDLTEGTLPEVINYAFAILNSLQGLFIFISGCLTDKKVLEALQKEINCWRSSGSATEHSVTSKSLSLKK